MKALQCFALLAALAFAPSAFAQYSGPYWIRVAQIDINSDFFVFVADAPAVACPGGQAWFTVRTADPQYKAVYKLVTTAKILGSKMQVWTVNGAGTECRPVFVELRAD